MDMQAALQRWLQNVPKIEVKKNDVKDWQILSRD